VEQLLLPDEEMAMIKELVYLAVTEALSLGKEGVESAITEPHGR